MHVWLLRAAGSLEQVGMFIVAAGTLGQRRAVGAPIAASGTRRGPGSIDRLRQGLFEARGGSNISLVSATVPAIIAIRSASLSPSRRYGVVRDVGALTRVLVWRGLIRRPV